MLKKAFMCKLGIIYFTYRNIKDQKKKTQKTKNKERKKESRERNKTKQNSTFGGAF